MSETQKTEATQKTVFTKWCNVYLKERKIEDLYTDFSDGLLLIALINGLSGGAFKKKFNQNPRSDIQKRENLSLIVDHIKTNIKIENIGAEGKKKKSF